MVTLDKMSKADDTCFGRLVVNSKGIDAIFMFFVFHEMF